MGMLTPSTRTKGETLAPLIRIAGAEAELPPLLTDSLQEILTPGEQLLLAVRTDMTLDGTYDESWLIVTDRQIVVYDDIDRYAPDTPALQLPVTEVLSAKARHLYGNGTLELTTRTATIDIIRYSRSLSSAFETVASYLNKLVESGVEGLKDAELLAQKHPAEVNKCPKCGRTLPWGSNVCPFCVEKKKVLVRLLGYLKPYWALATFTLFLSMAVTGLGLMDPIMQKLLVDEAIGKHDLRLLVWIVIGYLGIHGINAVLHMLRGYYMSYMGQKVTYDLSTEVYAHLQKLSMSFYDKRQTGSIMTRVTGDVNRLQNFIVFGLQDTLIQILTVIFITVIVLTINWKLAAIALLPMPVVGFGTALFAKRIHKVYHRIWRRISEVNAILGDTIPGIRVVKAFGREKEETERFAAKQKELLDSHMQAVGLSSVFYPAMGFVMIIGAAFIWGYGGYRVIQETQGITAGGGSVGVLTLGDLLAFIGYMWRLYGPIQQLSRLSGMFQEAITSAERVFEVLDTQPEVQEAVQPVDIEIKGNIEFDNVSFGYEKGEPILKNINLTIKAGEMIGVVGASGAGKTTLINLLCRFYDVTEGAIRIDGVDIRQLSLRSLREQLAIVPQESFLFHASIAQNLAYGKPDATPEEIMWAAKMANAHDFIMEFPDGYDTRLGERGVGLSGGQKQRISIARAILMDPKILILDEATSAVDTETERLIQEAINRLVKGRTTIAIAHRLSTLKNADRIVVLEGGRIVEVGTHDELLSKEDGVFARLVRMQSEIARTHVV
ncbi:MAG: ABC transporter ATP-binding protein [Limnochordales bacterium]|nr:ABC transporter ATP-binding protein [Limnochordales bacterium]